MLSIYRQLFNELHSQGLVYLVYKGIEHLDEDLAGARGDLDLLVAEREIDRFDVLVQSLGFIRHANYSARPLYYFAIDPSTGKTAKLDVDWNIKIGVRPFVTHYIPVDVERIQSSLRSGCVRVVAPAEYLPLFFLLKVTSNRRRLDHLRFLRTLSVQGAAEVGRGQYSWDLLKRAGIDVDALLEKISSATCWDDFHEDEERLLGFASVDVQRQWARRLHFFRRVGARVSAVLGRVQERVRRRGCLIAVAGADPGEVRSLIDYLVDIDYFRYTGIKYVSLGGGRSSLLRCVWRFSVAIYLMRLGNLVLVNECHIGSVEHTLARWLQRFGWSNRLPDMTCQAGANASVGEDEVVMKSNGLLHQYRRDVVMKIIESELFVR